MVPDLTLQVVFRFLEETAAKVRLGLSMVVTVSLPEVVVVLPEQVLGLVTVHVVKQEFGGLCNESACY